MKAAYRHGVSLTMALVAAAALSGCVDEKLVYRETPRFTEPPAAAASYVGYSNTDSKQTTCGNCHVDWQTKWATSKHSTAWADLQASGHATDACAACHTVNANGNADNTASAGYLSTKDARYEDVQCESCHGAGLSHISSPKSANRPLASIAVDTSATNLTGCAECHNDTHHPFVEEWRESAHGIGAELGHTGGNTSCQPCHTAQGALVAMGVTANYKEKSDAPLAITCAVCHDPHAKNNEAQLRLPVDVPDIEGNLCMKCHHKRGTPDMASQSRGPHSPEGPTLIGEAGWWPNGSQTLIATHGTDKNPKLCAGCHVNRFAVNDPNTGAFAWQATGHRFEAIPCLDATGKPVKGPCEISQRSFKACTASGCHGTEASARSAFIVAEERIHDLGVELNALVAQIPSTEFKQDAVLTVGEGAKFNAGFADDRVGPGSAVHNPFLIEALLTESIKAVKATYSLTAISPTLNLNNILPQQGKLK